MSALVGSGRSGFQHGGSVVLASSWGRSASGWLGRARCLLLPHRARHLRPSCCGLGEQPPRSLLFALSRGQRGR